MSIDAQGLPDQCSRATLRGPEGLYDVRDHMQQPFFMFLSYFWVLRVHVFNFCILVLFIKERMQTYIIDYFKQKYFTSDLNILHLNIKVRI